MTISESDVFLYNGGEGEYWVDSMLDAAGENIAVIARMMDYVDALDEEYVEGMRGADGHDHDHEHHHHHHADEIFTSWGMETPTAYTKDEIETILKKLDDADTYGVILRAKGMLPSNDGTWINFDYVPEESNVRTGAPEVTGKICVIGSKLNEDNLKALFTK